MGRAWQIEGTACTKVPRWGRGSGVHRQQRCWGGRGAGRSRGEERRAVHSCQAGERPWMSLRKREQLFTLKRPNKPAQRPERWVKTVLVAASASPLMP